MERGCSSEVEEKVAAVCGSMEDEQRDSEHAGMRK